jgi:1-acyl-sn-glycerol-3-phosphate acyltransferase
MENRLRDFTVTVILWTYYILGFIFFFSPFYLAVLIFSDRRDTAFQRLNYRLHRLFFVLLRALAPKVKWRIADDVKAIRSSVIIANHLSFLDPLLFVALFAKQKTIVKSDYFRLPVFGWILRTSGYIPSLAEGTFAADMVDQIKNMEEYLAEGGNLFIFPEGHRSRDGRIGPFDQGAFKIARLCRATRSRWCSSGIPAGSFRRASFCSIPAMTPPSRSNWPEACGRTTTARPFRSSVSWRRRDR